MTNRDRPSFLRLVSDGASRTSTPAAAPPRLGDVYQHAWQPTLFPDFNPRLAVAIDLDTLPKEDFVEIIERIRPRAIIDLRVIPRFDYAGFNRRVAFDFFAHVGSSYFDFTGDVGVKDDRDAKLNPAFVTDYVQTKVCRSKTACGPLVFLLGGREADDEYVPLLAQHLSADEAEWQWLRA
ncbi:hypothetical protein [Phenylobacterium sp.]|uniref:hypothetical protein n=1 Tax=Phenylobacterium sp. TaxID=1871053 RepID=UPI002737E1DA|nr:hypothetical protein [Phenylobacterium sp.]MDP3868021.1 hypothetical protein [Phenylobacterium sp.]